MLMNVYNKHFVIHAENLAESIVSDVVVLLMIRTRDVNHRVQSKTEGLRVECKIVINDQKKLMAIDYKHLQSELLCIDIQRVISSMLLYSGSLHQGHKRVGMTGDVHTITLHNFLLLEVNTFVKHTDILQTHLLRLANFARLLGGTRRISPSAGVGAGQVLSRRELALGTAAAER